MTKTLKQKAVEIPLYSSKIKAGFPSPADDTVERKLDLNDLIVKHPSSTFFVKVTGDSMVGAGIQEEDILVVDRALNARNGSIILAILNGEFTVKKFMKSSTGIVKLVPENPKYDPIVIRADDDFEVWGVVSFVIRNYE